MLFKVDDTMTWCLLLSLSHWFKLLSPCFSSNYFNYVCFLLLFCLENSSIFYNWCLFTLVLLLFVTLFVALAILQSLDNAIPCLFDVYPTAFTLILSSLKYYRLIRQDSYLKYRVDSLLTDSVFLNLAILHIYVGTSNQFSSILLRMISFRCMIWDLPFNYFSGG